ncbi:MAG: Hsp20/alpha crystallin family protein [Halapricum sp.]
MTHRPDHQIELFRDADAYVVYVDLPGYEESDIDVRWHDRRLAISAERIDEDTPRMVFYRSLGLPRDVVADAIEARYEDDVLEVTLPIANGEAKPGQEIPLS